VEASLNGTPKFKAMRQIFLALELGEIFYSSFHMNEVSNGDWEVSTKGELQ
jgi:hypothetical protein